MRRVVLPLLALAIGLQTCKTQDVELFPDDARVEADRTPDLGSQPVDLRHAVDERASPDTAPSCVCRLYCRDSSECTPVGAGSTCQLTVCSGSVSTCKTDTDCAGLGGTNWRCTGSPTSIDPC